MTSKLAADLDRVRIAGYAAGLSGSPLWLDGAPDKVVYGSDDQRLPEAVRGQFEQAYMQGVHDGYLRYAKLHPELFKSVEDVAALKGVAPNTLYRLLRNPERADREFMLSIAEGEGSGTRWYLHVEDVAVWQPKPQGRKRKEAITPV
jgi:hypothetical protein